MSQECAKVTCSSPSAENELEIEEQGSAGDPAMGDVFRMDDENSEEEEELLSSPIFARMSASRCTVARRCRDFYQHRLERTEVLQKRWSMCETAATSPPDEEQSTSGVSDPSECSGVSSDRVSLVQEGEEGHHPLRKWRSTMDLAMDNLRKEISSLITQDNDLFQQLLSLHDSIVELRERQRSCMTLCPDDDEEEGEEADHSNTPSLESLSDVGDQVTLSPDSTLSSRSSLSAVNPTILPLRMTEVKRRQRSSTVSGSRPLTFVSRTEFCWRCRTGSKGAPPYRRANSIAKLVWYDEDFDSYDSGIHLQGNHSDSDHEIFV